MSRATQPELTMRPAVEGDGTFIMRGDRNVAIVRQHADAVLFAAAPELLAACKAWAAYFDELGAAGCDPADPLTTERRKFHGKRIAATRAAIARATEATP